jgi:excisionase family DNA binding protein
MEIQPEMMSVKTLSKRLDISEKTIWDWVYKSRRQPTRDPIPFHKIGNLVRFRWREVDAWIERRRFQNPVAA